MTYQTALGLSERRAAERHKSVLTAGKIVVAGRDHFCLVRNVATGGLLIEMPEPPAAGSRVRIETAGLEACDASVIWREDRLAGLEFLLPQDVDLVGRRVSGEAGLVVRGPRFRSDRVAELRIADRHRVVEVVNISIGGAKLRGASGLESNALGQLIMGRPMPALLGNVRWSVGDEVGFKFAQPLSRESMAVLLS
ncbi:PilZ domain-containing protein [Sphingomonas panacisoli]|uniref:PilZ domain-containing protein n=1 Tax=Sphingomonas panacisoli TaxID=1813879 RepID=A0A5B8LJF5_9SPHN|nr:PilZ domain-containing protein [Sphingomonas panacisoli]QDZ07999.1 PilZ domain-containing protein [Sphingomonas panacisoli]